MSQPVSLVDNDRASLNDCRRVGHIRRAGLVVVNHFARSLVPDLDAELIGRAVQGRDGMTKH